MKRKKVESDEKTCKICEQPLPDDYRHDVGKNCKKKKCKGWWKKNWGWIAAGAAIAILGVAKVALDNADNGGQAILSGTILHQIMNNSFIIERQ